MKATKKASPKKSASRWVLGVFESAAHAGKLIAVYCKLDGTVSPYYAKSVTTKKAKFVGVYKGVTYAEARRRLMAESPLKTQLARGKAKKVAKTSSKKEALRRAA